MIKRLFHRLLRFYVYLRAVDGFGALLCILDDLRRKEKLRSLSIGGTRIHVRTNSPDLTVAISCLFSKEYEGISVPNAKFIIDAGANIGASALYFASKFPDARIVAVEPEDGNFDLLVKNSQHNKNIIPVKAAIWWKTQKKNIYDQHTGHWGYTIADGPGDWAVMGQEIDCVTIDSLMKTYGAEKIDLLKMDIEGAEKEVLENSSGWIDAVDVITAELHDQMIAGCSRAFYLALKDFKRFEHRVEKVTAYRN